MPRRTSHVWEGKTEIPYEQNLMTNLKRVLKCNEILWFHEFFTSAYRQFYTVTLGKTLFRSVLYLFSYYLLHYWSSQWAGSYSPSIVNILALQWFLWTELNDRASECKILGTKDQIWLVDDLTVFLNTFKSFWIWSPSSLQTYYHFRLIARFCSLY